MDQAVWDAAGDISNEVVDSFSALHPHIRMNIVEWQDLREMIEREVRGHFESDENGELLKQKAIDLLMECRV